MSNFNLNLVTNPLAARAGLIELHGQPVALPGVSSADVLLRGCDQRQWLKRLAAMGVRHLVVPLNGSAEDSCLYARGHPTWGTAAQSEKDGAAVEKPAPKRAHTAIYDLEHRDEGFFARLQFLLQAAEDIGVLLGFSVFKAGPQLIQGPFVLEGNLQGLNFSAALARRPVPDSKKTSLETGVEQALLRAVDWLAAEIRGQKGVWVSVFRGLPSPGHRARLNQLDELLTRRLAESLAGHGMDNEQARLGPWVVAASRFKCDALSLVRAPFDVRCGLLQEPQALPQPEDIAEEEEGWGFDSSPILSHRPTLFYFGEALKRREPNFKDHSYLWRCTLRGGWPVIPATWGGRRRVRCWRAIAQLASFARQWVERGYLRPCPELLASLPVQSGMRTNIMAATDGCGRYFVYFIGGRTSLSTITLTALPGSYRFYWFDPLTGRGLDRGDGLEAGPVFNVPGLPNVKEAILVLEQEELPDPFSVW